MSCVSTSDKSYEGTRVIIVILEQVNRSILFKRSSFGWRDVFTWEGSWNMSPGQRKMELVAVHNSKILVTSRGFTIEQ